MFTRLRHRAASRSADDAAPRVEPLEHRVMFSASPFAADLAVSVDPVITAIDASVSSIASSSDTTTADGLTGPVSLTLSIAKVKLAPSLVAGQSTRGSASLLITNASGETPTAGQTMSAMLVARPTDGGPDVVLGSVDGKSLRGPAPGRSARLSLRVTAGPELAAGEYDLVAVLVTSAAPDAPAHVASGQRLSVADPFVDLSGLSLSVSTKGDLYPGDTVKGKLAVFNAGNVAAKGNVVVDVFESTDPVFDAGDMLVATSASRRFTARSLGNGRVSFSATLSDDMDSGQQYLIARVRPVDGFTDVDAANDHVSSAAAIDFKPLVSLEDLRLYDRAGAWWSYDASYHDNLGNDLDGTVEVDVEPLSGAPAGSTRVTTYFDYDRIASMDLQFPGGGTRVLANGTFLGLGEGEFDFTFEPFDLTPPLFKPTSRTAFTHSTDVAGSFELGSVWGDVDGAMSMKVSLRGQKDVTLASGQAYADAYVVDLTTSFHGTISGEIDGEAIDISFTETLTQTLWTLPELGVVRMQSSSTLSAHLSGGPSERLTQSFTADLVSFHLTD